MARMNKHMALPSGDGASETEERSAFITEDSGRVPSGTTGRRLAWLAAGALVATAVVTLAWSSSGSKLPGLRSIRGVMDKELLSEPANAQQREIPPVAKEPEVAQQREIPPVVRCSWFDEDCSQSRCCNNVQCDYTFKNCQPYKCYKKDAYFAACKTGPPGGWDPTPIGEGRPLREVKPAPEGVKVQGTSLFCFAAVMWNAPPSQGWMDPEGVLANHWKARGLGIMNCDDHVILDGRPAAASGWGSVSNIDAFIQVWKDVKDDGRYRMHDWVVKVDPDAVFFPHRLKMHLYKLRTPQGSRVYLRNNAFKFQFMGALEVLTRQAVDLYYENEERCSIGGHSGGEDYWMKGCLDGIGVDHQVDFELLHDAYAAQNGCSDGWAAAFHFYKQVSTWDACHQQAMDAEAAVAAVSAGKAM